MRRVTINVEAADDVAVLDVVRAVQDAIAGDPRFGVVTLTTSNG